MRPLFPSRSLALHEALNEANLPDTCTATVPGGEWVKDGEGGGHWSGGEVITFPCRTWPLNPGQMEVLVAEQLREPGLEGMAMPHGQRLPANASVVITRGDTGETQAYEVKGRAPDSTFGRVSTAVLKRVRT